MRKWWVLVIVALLPAFAWSQSLGEAARREAERRRKIREASPSPKPPARPADAGRPPTPAPTSPSPPGLASPEPSPSRDESEPHADEERNWRERWGKAAARRDEAKRAHDHIQALINGDESYVDDRGRIVFRDLVQLGERRARAKEEWDAAEKALADLEDEARRRGARPEWLR